MLVISRRIGETLWIGPDVCVRVAAMRGRNVRLVIEAPNDKAIVRGELVDDAGGPDLREEADDRFRVTG